MPLVLRVKGYRVLFYALDSPEPPHVHVRRERKHAKFWLEPAVELEKNQGFRPHELNDIAKIVVEHRELILEKWHAFFGI
jgi:hypothetical protein